jgi:hypothetical protein
MDTNTFITPFKQYYSFSIVPSFWKFIEANISNGKIAMLDLVYDEIKKGTDELSDWVKALLIEKIDRREPGIIKVYGEIMMHIQSNPAYNEKALAAWAVSTRADAWVIAAAKVHNFTVVTFERPNASLGTSKSSNPKIPDVCKAFDVNCVDLFYVLNALGFSV